MAGFGLFLYGAMRAVCGIGKAVQNKQMKNYSYKIDEKGRPTWLDSEGNEYINGERVITKYNYDLGRIQEVGKISGTVYFDAVEEKNRKMRQGDKKELHLH